MPRKPTQYAGLSTPMTEALQVIQEWGGKTVRRGRTDWSETGSTPDPLDWTIHFATVEALHRRGKLKFTAFAEDSHGRFPIAAELVA